MKEHLVKEILSKEWKMFTKVINKGGKAPCQKDRKTFTFMRSSQFESLPIGILESYFYDLVVAERQGRNLMTEKYARMMEYTVPEEYKAIKDFLPKIDLISKKYIEGIIPIFLEWEKEFRREYPYLSSISRPAFSSEDKPSQTSFETYLKAEIFTYSPSTIWLYYHFIKEMTVKGINFSKQIQLNIVKQYGFSSLKEANESVKRKITECNSH